MAQIVKNERVYSAAVVFPAPFSWCSLVAKRYAIAGRQSFPRQPPRCGAALTRLVCTGKQVQKMGCCIFPKKRTRNRVLFVWIYAPKTLRMKPAATAEPITPATFGPMACMSRKFAGLAF